MHGRPDVKFEVMPEILRFKALLDNEINSGVLLSPLFINIAFGHIFSCCYNEEL